MTTPLIINNETMDEARDAIREIVMLYVGLADEGRFMHNHDAEGRLDCLRFVDAEADPKAYLVRHGAAEDRLRDRTSLYPGYQVGGDGRAGAALSRA